MTTRNAYCLGDFSLSPFFRRKWHSTYEAMQDCRPDRNQLMKRYVQEIPELEYVLLAETPISKGQLQEVCKQVEQKVLVVLDCEY